jgi:hypothetical protein
MTDEADRTIFDSSELTSEEKAAVRSGEERGKRAYEAEHPKCGIKTTQRYRDNYVEAFGHE